MVGADIGGQLICSGAKLNGRDNDGDALGHWHAHEGRHTAVSIMSSNGV
jgi:ankyrin repeat protein